MRKGILVFFVLNLIAGQGMAQTWEETFPEDAAVGKLVGGNLKVMVTGAGEEIFEATEAARALAKAVRKVPGVQLVMKGEALGNLTAASDEEIVQKCKNYSVHYIYIVRVFEGASPEKPAVLVTIYNMEGKAVANASGEKGVSIGSGSGAASAGEGEGQDVAPAEDETWGEEEESDEGWSEEEESDEGWSEEEPPQTAAVAEGAAIPVEPEADVESEAALNATDDYAARYVWFEDWQAMDVDTGGASVGWTVPYKGKQMEPLNGSAFYRYLQREDLAQQYRKRAILKWSIFGGGGAVLLGGLGVLFAGLVKDVTFDEKRVDCDIAYPPIGSPAHSQCLAGVTEDEADAEKSRKTLIIVGSVITTLGAGGMFAGAFYRAHPIPASEAHQLAEGFNQDLKKKLGLQPEYQVPMSSLVRPKAPPKLGIVPVVAGATNGMVLNVSF